MKSLVMAWALSLAGCFVQAAGGVTYDGGHVSGAAVEGTVGLVELAEARMTDQLAVRQVTQSNGSKTTLATDDAGVRFSVIGTLFPTSDRAHWIRLRPRCRRWRRRHGE